MRRTAVKERATDTAVITVGRDVDDSWYWYVRWRNTRTARSTRNWSKRSDAVKAAEQMIKVVKKAVLIAEMP